MNSIPGLNIFRRWRLAPRVWLAVAFSFGMALGVSAQVTLQADGGSDAYALLSSVLGGTPYEVPDCGHAAFGPHITEAWDSTLGEFVFVFHIHVNEDNDRCVNFDRQRNEIKTYGPSPAYLKGMYGDTCNYRWKFKLDAGFQPSPNFCHIHQIKAGDGSDAGSPLMTITPRSGTPERLEIIYTAPSGLNGSGTKATANLSGFKGQWIEAFERVHYATNGSYELTLRCVSDGVVLLSYTNSNLNLWRGDATFNRPKWGIYRSLNSSSYLRDEQVLFADFCIGKGSDMCPSDVGVVSSGIVARLTFDDGTANDTSGYGNNGTLMNGASIVTDPERGKVLLLDGTDDYVDLGNGSSLNLSDNNQATITAWVKVAASKSHNSIVTKGEWKEAYSLLINGNTATKDQLWTGNDTSVYSGAAILLNTWTHVAVVINGDLTTFYINGQLSGTANQDRGNAIDNTSTGVSIGREQYSGSLPAGRWFFNGEMDDVRIYNKALTQSEIQRAMSNVADTAPAFASHPLIEPTANAGQSYTGSLAGTASDPDAGDTGALTFSKISGPDWLLIAGDGSLSGTPLNADSGTNSFNVRVSDSSGFFDETTLNIAVLPARPQIAGITLSGGSLIFSGTNGVPGHYVYLLASTNVALPLDQWAMVVTNSFDFNGNSSFTNATDAIEPQMFYLLQLP